LRQEFAAAAARKRSARCPLRSCARASKPPLNRPAALLCERAESRKSLGDTRTPQKPMQMSIHHGFKF